jgi:hypothetical protein
VKCLIETYTSEHGKKEKEHSIKTAPQSNRKSKKQTKIYIPYTYIHDHSLALVGTGTSIKLVVVNLFF